MEKFTVINIIFGLGNPGKEYEKTYHNLGFMAVDSLARDFSITFSKKNTKSIFGEGMIDGKKVVLVKPQTYMNLSGEAVELFRKKYADGNIIVVCDDVDLPKETVRFRQNGSGGTHNGLKNIVAHIGEEFSRIKIGVGRDENMDLADYVLSKIKDDDYLNGAIEKAKKLVIENLL